MTQKETRLENSRNEWKAKNKERYDEIKALKMRLKETAESRDKWKTIVREQDRVLAEKEQSQKEASLVIASLKQELENFKKNKRY
jgi:hypothetical protein